MGMAGQTNEIYEAPRVLDFESAGLECTPGNSASSCGTGGTPGGSCTGGGADEACSNGGSASGSCSTGY